MAINSTVNDSLLQRIYAEFLEMPGLRLTCEQAQRLWGLDRGTCHELLERLVAANFLWRRPGSGMYARLTEGPDPGSPVRMTTKLSC